MKLRISKKKQKKGVTKLSILIKRLDKVFSEYIRQRDNGVCFTCGLQREWKYQQNGHYISRTYKNTRWLESNCHTQCVGCNVFRKGNMDVYALRLIEKYGAEHLKHLDNLKHAPYTPDRKWLESQISYYQKLCKQF